MKTRDNNLPGIGKKFLRPSEEDNIPKDEFIIIGKVFRLITLNPRVKESSIMINFFDSEEVTASPIFAEIDFVMPLILDARKPIIAENLFRIVLLITDFNPSNTLTIFRTCFNLIAFSPRASLFTRNLVEFVALETSSPILVTTKRVK